MTTKHEGKCCELCEPLKGEWPNCRKTDCPCHIPEAGMEWRKNIVALLEEYYLTRQVGGGIPMIIMDSVDAAYVAGLDARKPEVTGAGVREEIAEILRGNYSCGRVWEAWNYGTMKQEDFAPLEESDEIIDSFVKLFEARLSRLHYRIVEEVEKKSNISGLVPKEWDVINVDTVKAIINQAFKDL